jgi:hypothetical protein
MSLRTDPSLFNPKLVINQLFDLLKNYSLHGINNNKGYKGLQNQNIVFAKKFERNVPREIFSDCKRF